jgi:hypothetical protein
VSWQLDLRLLQRAANVFFPPLFPISVSHWQWAIKSLTSLFLALNVRNDRLYLREFQILDGKSDHASIHSSYVTYSNLAIAFHNTDLDILGSSLHHLEQTFNCQFDAFISGHVVSVILLQKFSNGFRRSPNRNSLYNDSG